MFGMATIRFGIGPHSSSHLIHFNSSNCILSSVNLSLKYLVPAGQLVLHKYELMKRKSKNLDRCRECTRCSEWFENCFQFVLHCVRVDNDYPLNIFAGDAWLMSLTNWLSDWMNCCRLWLGRFVLWHDSYFVTSQVLRFGHLSNAETLLDTVLRFFATVDKEVTWTRCCCTFRIRLLCDAQETWPLWVKRCHCSLAHNFANVVVVESPRGFLSQLTCWPVTDVLSPWDLNCKFVTKFSLMLSLEAGQRKLGVRF